MRGVERCKDEVFDKTRCRSLTKTMDPIPITSLAPETAPPANKSIRGIVTLFWPYSSSTRQCALLLADPDFRLRSRKGQVRIRFTGATAEAVAKSRVGIGDEVVLGLNGAAWEEDAEATRTPGKSVDGELVFRRKLGLKIAKAEGEVDVNVDAPVSPPRIPEKIMEVETLVTPLQKPVNGGRLSLEGTVDGLPTYDSPAFVKRLRLSGQSFLDSAFDPFAGDDIDLEKPNKKQRTSFGSNLKWRYAETTPSPRKNMFAYRLEHAEGREGDGEDVRDEQENAQAPAMMPPPALPRLRMPSDEAIGDASKLEQLSEDQQEAPSTPKLQPVKSPTLPLPSPFPAETVQPLLGLAGSARSMQTQSFGRSARFQDQAGDVENAGRSKEPGIGDDVDVEIIGHDAMIPGLTVYGNFSDTEPDEEADEETLVETNSIEGQTESDAQVSQMTDDLAHDFYEDDAEEIIEPSDVEPPNEQESDGHYDEGIEELSEDDEPAQEAHDRGQVDEEHIELSEQLAREQAMQEPPERIQVGEEQLTQSEQLALEQPETPQKYLPDAFGLDGITSTGPSPQITPQSEKDRIMAKTFKSLFGFKTSPVFESTPQVRQPPEPERPIFRTGVSSMDQPGLEAHLEDAQQPNSELQSGLHVPQAESVLKVQRLSGPKIPIPPTETSEPPQSSLQADGVHSVEIRQPAPRPQELSTPSAEVVDPKGEDEEAAQTSQLPPPSSGRPSTTEVIYLGSSSEEEDEEIAEQHGESLTPTGPQKGFASPEPQDLLEDSEHQDLLHLRFTQNRVVDDTSGRFEQHTTDEEAEKNDEMRDATPEESQAPERHVSPDDSTVASITVEREGTAQRTVYTVPKDAIEDTYDADEPLRSTATTTVIELGSSSPVEQLGEGQPEERAAAGTDLFDDFIEADKLGSSPLDQEADHAAVEEGDRESEPKASPPHVEVTSIDETMQMQPQAPQYPSLPLSPSNSQSLQDMFPQPAVESQMPETLRSVLPPTPQLTQAESSAQLQTLVNEGNTPKSRKKTPMRKSLTARLSNVPEVISDWFSPKRSSGFTVEEIAKEPGEADRPNEVAENDQVSAGTAFITNGHTSAQNERPLSNQIQTNGLATSLAYFTRLSKLDEFLNPSSQQSYGSNTIDIFAVVKDKTKEPVRAKSGPKDYFTIFRITDSNPPDETSVRVEVFRPWMATLPVADIGDVILLRDFAVKSRKRQAYLLSTDASAWCVWRYADAAAAENEAKKPVWAQKKSTLNGSGVREEVKGPPVEFGGEERGHAQQLHEWWQAARQTDEQQEVEDMADDTGANGHITQPMDAKL